MRIILDGVFNHVGRRHWAFRDLLEKQRASRFADWFKVRSFADEPGGFQYESLARPRLAAGIPPDRRRPRAGPACLRRGRHAALDGARRRRLARHRRLAAGRRALAAARLLEALAAHGEGHQSAGLPGGGEHPRRRLQRALPAGRRVRRGDELQLRLRLRRVLLPRHDAHHREPLRRAAARAARGLPGLRGAGDAEPVRQPRHRAAGLARDEPRPARLPRLRRDLPPARLARAGASTPAGRTRMRARCSGCSCCSR